VVSGSEPKPPTGASHAPSTEFDEDDFKHEEEEEEEVVDVSVTIRNAQRVVFLLVWLCSLLIGRRIGIDFIVHIYLYIYNMFVVYVCV
jgi:hypothetical protein